MDKENKPQRRASLRGKGREILLGQQGDAASSEPGETSPTASPAPGTTSDAAEVDAAALDLTAEEANALLDLSPDAAVYDADVTFPDPPMDAPHEVQPEARSATALPPEEQDAPDLDGTLHNWAVPDDVTPVAPDDMASFFADEPVPVAVADHDPVAPPRNLDDYPPLGGDAVPLAERSPEAASQIVTFLYRVHPDVEALVPRTPETWDEDGMPSMPVALGEAPYDGDHEGGPYEADVVEPSAAARPLIPDPFAPTPERLPAAEVFADTAPAKGDLLTMLVNDERIQGLAAQIDALHDEIADHFHGDQQTADVYQQELLQASSLLMASRENYDDARAIVYRIRTDMNRRRKVDEAIERYRPVLLLYYIGWGISLVVLILLKALFTGVTDAVGIETAAAMYYPMLLGVAGALLSGFMTLERHTTRLRDFDPIHISWYMLNPFLGGVMGLLMFLLASIANEDLLRESASDAEHAITYLLCVVAGMNQNNVLRQLNDLLKRFGRSGDQN